MAKRLQKSFPGERSVRNLLDPVHVGSPSLGIEYRQVVVETLGKLSRHKLLITAIVAAALVLGIIASLAIPKRYTAEAFIREGLAASDSVTAARGTSGERPIAFDASLLVETRAQLFQSHQLARQVVQRLGLERLRPIVRQGRLSTWLQREFYGVAMSAPEYQADMAATRLMRDLSVKTEPRVYQIVLRYSAKDPELATAVTNAFVVEFLRTTSLQKLSGQRAAAQAALSENLATLGDKHPKVRAERMRLAGAESLMKEQLTKTPDEIQKSAGENITFAEASVIPSSPNPPLIIGLTFLAGLGVGIGLALRLERTPQLQRSQELELARDRGFAHSRDRSPQICTSRAEC
jgi:uncharacterized protein involved in exopolysaccharide biosynthesis